MIQLQFTDFSHERLYPFPVVEEVARVLGKDWREVKALTVAIELGFSVEHSNDSSERSSKEIVWQCSSAG